MADKAMSAEDKQWRGRDAARTLMEAEKIRKDPVLSKLAAKEAQSLAKEHQANASAMTRVARVASSSKPKAVKSAPAKSKRK